jgi:hypothetical protein
MRSERHVEPDVPPGPPHVETVAIDRAIETVFQFEMAGGLRIGQRNQGDETR